MGWFRSGLHRLSGWLTPPQLPADFASASPEQLAAIRQAMLDALGPAGAARQPGLAARIRFCREVETLWALRAELMNVSLQLYGESHARKHLTRLTALFEGILPQASCAQRTPVRSRTAPWRRH